MNPTVEYRDDFLCVVEEEHSPTGLVTVWFPIRKAEYPQSQTLLGRPLTSVDRREGIYVDEEGNVYQLADKGETKPIAVESIAEREKTDLEVLLEASLRGEKNPDQMWV